MSNKAPQELFSREVEEALVGSALLDPVHADLVDDGDFYIRRHGLIWSAIRRLRASGQAVDPVLVAEQLGDDGKLDDVGGLAFLMELVNQTPSSLHAPDYAESVLNFSKRRQMLYLATELGKAAINDHVQNGRYLSILDELVDLNAGVSSLENIRDPWQTFTLADAYKEREPIQYIAAGIFELPSLNILYGPPGTLKSFFLADLAVCVAAGIEWLPPAPWKAGAEPFPTKQVPVMWLDFDNGKRRTHERFEALGRARDLPSDIPLFYYSMPDPWLSGSDKGSIGALALRAKERGVKFICIDNLGAVTGRADENSNQMVEVMSLFRQLAEETGAAETLIHHQRKNAGNVVRAGDNLRGHSSIEAAIDLGLIIEREENSDIINLKSTKTRGLDVLPFSAAFTCEHKPNGDLGKARFFGLAVEDTSSGLAVEKAIIETLTGRILNKTDLTNTVKILLPSVGVNRIRDRIDRLVASGKITEKAGVRTEKRYSLI